MVIYEFYDWLGSYGSRDFGIILFWCKYVVFIVWSLVFIVRGNFGDLFGIRDWLRKGF